MVCSVAAHRGKEEHHQVREAPRLSIMRIKSFHGNGAEDVQELITDAQYNLKCSMLMALSNDNNCYVPSNSVPCLSREDL